MKCQEISEGGAELAFSDNTLKLAVLFSNLEVAVKFINAKTSGKKSLDRCHAVKMTRYSGCHIEYNKTFLAQDIFWSQFYICFIFHF